MSRMFNFFVVLITRKNFSHNAEKEIWAAGIEREPIKMQMNSTCQAAVEVPQSSLSLGEFINFSKLNFRSHPRRLRLFLFSSEVSANRGRRGAGNFRAWHEKNNREENTKLNKQLRADKMKSFVLLNGEKRWKPKTIRYCLNNTLFSHGNSIIRSPSSWALLLWIVDTWR